MQLDYHIQEVIYSVKGGHIVWKMVHDGIILTWTVHTELDYAFMWDLDKTILQSNLMQMFPRGLEALIDPTCVLFTAFIDSLHKILQKKKKKEKSDGSHLKLFHIL